MILFVFILGTVASGVLMGMELLTAQRIEANQEVELRRTVLEAFDIPYKMTTINEVYEKEITIKSIEGLSYYVSPSDEIGFTYEGSGVWGPIKGFVAVDAAIETLRYVAVLQQEETPGLGGVVAEAPFLEQFVGVKVVPSLEINQSADPSKENEVEAITGATRTSKAFETILNSEIGRYRLTWQQRED
ncbi:FMN-binding protein [Cellulosilyticum sp. I15G10I2]|uniref:FMN-binding protein n=1 Tax=Cellulosilyticum sp. I15G10I2 TaxID=1892843 RepID=UPI00114C980C|nr:FMN-binding protein [Cellulosilyticum sp. I15G10I2]